MGTLYNEIDWIHESERGTPEVANRPLKQLVTKLDNYEYTNSTIPLADIDLEGGINSVEDGDVVYRYENPLVAGEYIYGKAIFNTETNNTYRKDKPFGVVKNYEGSWYLIFAGAVEIEGSNFNVGQFQYLSDTTLGGVMSFSDDKPFPGAIRIGKALTPTHILVEVDEDRVIEQGSYEFPDNQKGDIDDSDLVYFTGTKYEKAKNSEDDENRLVGFYKSYGTKHYIVYDGLVKVVNNDLEVGKDYFLSDSVSGDYKKFDYNGYEAPNAIKIGRAVSTDYIVVNISERVIPEKSLFQVHSTEVATLADGDIVYKNGAIYSKAISDTDDASEVVGIYKLYEGKHYIVYAGLVELSGIVAGQDYYLSDTVEGVYKTYDDLTPPQSMKIGRGIDAGVLLLDIQRHEYHENGVYEFASSKVGTISDSDFVFFDVDTGKYEKGFNSGVNEEVIAGMYKIYDSRHYIVYDGYVRVTNTTLVPGKQYYLSTDELDKGKVQLEYTEVSVSVGIAVDAQHLIVSVDRNKASATFFSLPVVSSEIGDIVNFDIVYKELDTGLYEKALSDGSETGNAVGFYMNMGLQHYIIFAGALEFTPARLDSMFGVGERFEVGSIYYIDATVKGGITLDKFPGAVKAGIAVTDTLFAIDIDNPASDGVIPEALEYEFFLQQSPFSKCYVETFERPYTALTTGSVVYVARETAYLAQNEGDIIGTNESIFGPDNTDLYDMVYPYINDNNNGAYYDVQYSFDSSDGTDGIWYDGKHQQHIITDPAQDNMWFRFVRNDTALRPEHDAAYLYSYGILYDEDGISGMSTGRMREYYEVPEDVEKGEIITVPNQRKYTNDRKSLDVYLNGLILRENDDYIEVDERRVRFVDTMEEGWIIEFREYYGYVDVSAENSLRLHNLEIDVGDKEDIIMYSPAFQEGVNGDSLVKSININEVEKGDYRELTVQHTEDIDPNQGEIAKDIITALNVHDLEIGNIYELTTTGIDVVSSINEHDFEIGDLATMTTTYYDDNTPAEDLVRAHNIHDAEIGRISKLQETTDSGDDFSERFVAQNLVDGLIEIDSHMVTTDEHELISGLKEFNDETPIRTISGTQEELLSKWNLDGYKENKRHETYTGNLDAIVRNSVYNIDKGSVTNEPDDLGAWAFVVTMMHTNSDTYGTQVAYAMNDASNNIWVRQKIAGVWRVWTKTLRDNKSNELVAEDSHGNFIWSMTSPDDDIEVTYDAHDDFRYLLDAVNISETINATNITRATAVSGDIVSTTTVNDIVSTITSSGNYTETIITDNFLYDVKAKGDLVIRLQSDTDNVDESDNVAIEMSQDGGLVYFKQGIDGNNTSYIDVQDGSTEGTLEFRSTLDSSNYNSGSLAIKGGVGIARRLNVGGDVDFAKTLDVTGATRLLSTLAVTGATTLNNTLYVLGNTTLGNAVTDTTRIRGTVTLSDNGKLTRVEGTLDVDEATKLKSSLYVLGTTTLGDSSADITRIRGTVTLSDTGRATVINGSLDVAQSVSFGSNLTVTGNGTFNGNNILGNSTSDTLTINATTTVTADMRFTDNDHLYFGSGKDLDIYHDGSNSFIEDQGTGSMYIRSTSGDLYLRTSTTENAIWCDQNEGVHLYYNGSQRFETTSTGATVNGKMTISDVSASASPSLYISHKVDVSDSYGIVLEMDGEGKGVSGSDVLMDLRANTSASLTTSANTRFRVYGDGALDTKGDINITKNRPWITLDSSSEGTIEQSAGITLGESAGASISMTYTGDGYGHIGMGSLSTTTGIPAYEAMRIFYTNNNTDFLSILDASSTTVAGARFRGGVAIAKKLYVGTSVYAPIYYDSDITGYYGNFAGTSRMNHINLTSLLVYNDTTLGDSTGDALTIKATTTVQADMRFDDNKHLYLGNSSDLDIYHSGSHSYIEEQGTGNLYIQSTGGDLILRNSSSENAIWCDQNAGVHLYNNGVEKLATNSSGVTVEGTVQFNSSGEGIYWSSVTDTASIKFITTTDSASNNRLEFRTGDNGNENFAWVTKSGSSADITRMSLNSGSLYVQSNLSVSGNTTLGNATTDTTRIRGVVTLSDNGKNTKIEGTLQVDEYATFSNRVKAVTYARHNHHTGHLEGSYNNVGGNSLKSNPIYTIGSSYNPSDASLGNMYGIGFTDASASFIGSQTGAGWGMYVASDGDARIFLNGSNGKAYLTATSARYADVAENYFSDEVQVPGTVMGIGGDNEITMYEEGMKLAGVVSTDPALLMNNTDEIAENELYLAIALKGKIPCFVTEAKKGQYLLAGKDGKGYGVDDYDFNESKRLIGICLEDSIDGTVTVKV